MKIGNVTVCCLAVNSQLLPAPPQREALLCVGCQCPSSRKTRHLAQLRSCIACFVDFWQLLSFAESFTIGRLSLACQTDSFSFHQQANLSSGRWALTAYVAVCEIACKLRVVRGCDFIAHTVRYIHSLLDMVHDREKMCTVAAGRCEGACNSSQKWNVQRLLPFGGGHCVLSNSVCIPAT